MAINAYDATYDDLMDTQKDFVDEMLETYNNFRRLYMSGKQCGKTVALRVLIKELEKRDRQSE